MALFADKKLVTKPSGFRQKIGLGFKIGKEKGGLGQQALGELKTHPVKTVAGVTAAYAAVVGIYEGSKWLYRRVNRKLGVAREAAQR